MKKRRKLIMIPIIIMIIVAFFIFFRVFKDLNMESKIKKEINEVVQIFGTENIDSDDINTILDRRLIKNGEYAELEDSIKTYYKDLYDDIKNLTFLMDDSNYGNYLSSDNLIDDGPSFVKSKNNLVTAKSQLNDCYDELINQLTDENEILSYIKDKKLNNYYNNLYLDIINEYTPNNLEDDITTKYKKVLNNIDVYNDIFDFLVTNKGHWSIQNDVITFDDSILLEKYNELTNKLETND